MTIQSPVRSPSLSACLVGLAMATASHGAMAATIALPVAADAVHASADDGNVAANTVDGNRATRWSAKGDGQWIRYDLGRMETVSFVRVQWHQGNQRRAHFRIELSPDGSRWTSVHAGSSSGTTTGRETYHFADTAARYVRIVGGGNSSGNGWNSILETEIWGQASSQPPGQAAMPAFSPAGGRYAEAQSVRIQSSTAGATIRYTLDGTQPSATHGTVYTGPIQVTTSRTLKAVAAKNGLALSTVQSASYVIGGGGSGPDPGLPPGRNFDLSKWKITLPINDAEEHSAAELVAGYTHPRHFFTDPVSGGMVFQAPNIGTTTSKSNYTRSELREMLKPAGRANDPANNWVLSSSGSSARTAAGGVDGTLKAILTVDRVSTTGDAKKVGRVIVGQIHAPDTEIVRLYYHKLPGNHRGRIYTAQETADGKTTTYTSILGGDRNGTSDPADGIALGEVWAYEIKAVGDALTVTITPPGRAAVSKRIAIDPGYRNQSQYFKAGVYNQNNTGTASDYAKATFHSLSHTHP